MEAFAYYKSKGRKDREKTESPKEIEKCVTRKELIEQLEAHVEYFEKLPNHEKFSFAINADLYYFMMVILNIFKKDLHEQ